MDLEDLMVLYRTEQYKYYKPTTPDNNVIQTYLVFESHADYLDKYLNFYRGLPDFTQVIVNAVDGIFELTNKGILYFLKHNHQKFRVTPDGSMRGVDPVILKRVRDKLIKQIDTLSSLDSFDKLFETISKSKEPGFGPLAIYDTSLRIAAYLGFAPDKVFLHAGGKAGLKMLEEKGYIEIGKSNEEFLDVEYLPSELHGLRPLEIEHFLCSQKDKFKELNIKLLQ